MNEVIRYKIEARNLVTGYWEVKREYMCHYEYETYWKRVLWWKILKSRITNKNEAELRCRERAMLWAFEIYRGMVEDVRVINNKWIDGYNYKILVWENGEWKDC